MRRVSTALALAALVTLGACSSTKVYEQDFDRAALEPAPVFELQEDPAVEVAVTVKNTNSDPAGAPIEVSLRRYNMLGGRVQTKDGIPVQSVIKSGSVAPGGEFKTAERGINAIRISSGKGGERCVGSYRVEVTK